LPAPPKAPGARTAAVPRSAHRWRPLRDCRTVKGRRRAAIRRSAGFGRIPVLRLPSRQLKEALPCQPRTRRRHQEARDDHRTYPGRDHNAEMGNFHSAYELLNTAASKHHPLSRYGSPPRPRSQLRHGHIRALPRTASRPRLTAATHAKRRSNLLPAPHTVERAASRGRLAVRASASVVWKDCTAAREPRSDEAKGQPPSSRRRW
jgi:hypothetical protein